MTDGSEVAAKTPALAGRLSYPPIVWLNLLCLDAPIVAVAWQWLFGRIFAAQLTLPVRELLFLTAWLIYLADRFADIIGLRPESPISLRHQFCRGHMVGWWIAIVVIFFFDLSIAIRNLDLQMFLLGGTLAALCFLYLFLNRSLGGKWPLLPMKEKAIGLLFAAGTALGVVAHLPGLTIAFGVALLLFAILCTYNCLSIAAWERELDEAQAKATFMTGWPKAARALDAIGYGLVVAAIGFGLIWRFALPLWLCLAGSAFLLVRLNNSAHLARDRRTALADIVMLTPFLVLLFSLR
jgi:hypothetical protein